MQFVLVATYDLIFSQYAPQLAILVLFLSEQSIIEGIYLFVNLAFESLNFRFKNIPNLNQLGFSVFRAIY